MQLCDAICDYGRVHVPDSLLEYIRALPRSAWQSRVDRESKDTLVIRQGSPAFPWQMVDEILDKLPLPPGYQNRKVLSNVPAGKSILPHTDDFGEIVAQQSVHCHIPLITTESVVMRFDDDDAELHLEFGHLYTMDATQTHSVYNPSDIDRIHLLFAHFPHGG